MALLPKYGERNKRIYPSSSNAKIDKGKITKANKKHGNKFSPKYMAFNIL